MTPRRINALYGAHLDLLTREYAHVLNQLLPKKKELSIDDIIPM